MVNAANGGRLSSRVRPGYGGRGQMKSDIYYVCYMLSVTRPGIVSVGRGFVGRFSLLTLIATCSVCVKVQ